MALVMAIKQTADWAQTREGLLFLLFSSCAMLAGLLTYRWSGSLMLATSVAMPIDVLLARPSISPGPLQKILCFLLHIIFYPGAEAPKATDSGLQLLIRVTNPFFSFARYFILLVFCNYINPWH